MLVDRGLAGYPLLAQLVHADKDIVARCSTGSFGAAQELFGLNQDGVRRRARLSATSDQRASLRANLESVLSAPAAQVWAEHREECQFARQVNRADAFHALKTHVVELLCGNTPAEGWCANCSGGFCATRSVCVTHPTRRDSNPLRVVPTTFGDT